jgi:peptide/nickel transport system substrate-binding protein
MRVRFHGRYSEELGVSTRSDARLLLVVAALALFAVVSPSQAEEKVFVYALDGPPESLDPAKANSVRAQRLNWLRFDTLVNVSRDGLTIENGLAERHELSDGGRTVTLYLRRGVLFHDGTEVKADAVLKSFDRQYKARPEDKAIYPNAEMLTNLIQDAQQIGDYTLTFRLKYPGLHRLSDIEIVKELKGQETRTDEHPDGMVGTGPFMLSKIVGNPYRQIVLGRFNPAPKPNRNLQYKHWLGTPEIERVVFDVIPSEHTVVSEFLNGKVDFSPSLTNPDLIDRLGRSDKVRLKPIPGLNLYYLGLMYDRDPFQKKEMRQALTQALNVPRLSTLGRGLTDPARGPLPPAMKYYDPTVSQPAYDPKRAQETLKNKLGLSDELPKKLTLVYNNSMDLHASLAKYIEGELDRAGGITLELVPKQNHSELVAAVRRDEADMFIYSWFVRGPYPERLLTPLFHSKYREVSNLTHYANPKVDDLLDKAVLLPDGPSKKAMYSSIQRIIVDDLPMVFLYHLTRMAVYNSRVQGLELKLDAMPYDKLVGVRLKP